MGDYTSQLGSTYAPALLLVELQFASGTSRLSNWNHDLSWGGHTWLGLSAVVSFGRVTQAEALTYPGLEIGLQVANPAWLALARGNVSEYRGRGVLVYLAALDDELRVQGTPQVFWSGAMDQIRLKTGNGIDEEGAVALRCEMPGRDGRHAASLRLTDAQHQARYPGDTFLSRVEALTGKPVPWLSVRFQQR